jgi:hypothetical protein
MKVIEYNRYGENKEYCDIVFEDSIYKVKAWKVEGKEWMIESEDVPLSLIQEVIKVIDSHFIEIEV